MEPMTIVKGISAVAGLFGKKKQSWVVPDYAGVRKAAIKGGFNPLTALSMNAGSAGAVQPSFGQKIGAAAGAVGDALSEQRQLDMQQTALDQREREIAIKEKAADHLQSQARIATGIGQRQAAIVGGAKSEPVNIGKAKGSRDVGTHVIDQNASGIVVDGSDFIANPSVSDGEEIERRYGDSEIVSTLYASYALGADVGHNLRIKKAQDETRERLEKVEKHYKYLANPHKKLWGANDERNYVYRATQNPNYNPSHWR